MPFISFEQKLTMVEYMEGHTKFAAGQNLGVESWDTVQGMWEQVTLQLHSKPGARKSAEKWRKVWTDMKSRTKKRAAAIRKYSTGTGGGSPSSLILTEMDERVLNILAPESVYGFEDNSLPGESGTSPQTERSVGVPTPSARKRIRFTEEEPIASTSAQLPMTSRLSERRRSPRKTTQLEAERRQQSPERTPPSRTRSVRPSPTTSTQSEEEHTPGASRSQRANRYYNTYAAHCGEMLQRMDVQNEELKKLNGTMSTISNALIEIVNIMKPPT